MEVIKSIRRMHVIAFALTILITLGSTQVLGQKFTIKNRWKNTWLIAQGAGVNLGSSSQVWIKETVSGTSFIRLKHEASGKYLHNQNGSLELGSIAQGWWSAMWTEENVSGYVRFKNRWKGTYIHTEQGAPALGSIQPGWWSAMWEVKSAGSAGSGGGGGGGSTSAYPAPLPGFYMIMASDPQWDWTYNTDAGVAEPDRSARQALATTLNNNHINVANDLYRQYPKMKGIIINGDLTEGGHGPQLDKFKELYSKLTMKAYYGLGNHDYANYVDDTWENRSANGMVDFMVDHIKSNGASSYDVKVSNSYEFPENVTTTTGSLAYSWDIDNVHFVQLQNFPTYQRTWSSFVSNEARRRTYEITHALNWLEGDLAKARNAGKVIVLNFHDLAEHWSDSWVKDASSLKTRFVNMLNTYNVGAIFVGHLHSNLGRSSNFGGSSTPVFFCGSASQSKYLLVNFNGTRMTVYKVSTKDGKAAISTDGSYTLSDAKPVNPVQPKQDGYVTFFNEAGYVARYTLTYTLNGQTKKHETGNIALGNKRRYTIPADATNIKVKGEGQTGLVWEPWKTTFEKSYSSPPTVCFKSYGTTLSQKWNNNCE